MSAAVEIIPLPVASLAQAIHQLFTWHGLTLEDSPHLDELTAEAGTLFPFEAVQRSGVTAMGALPLIHTPAFPRIDQLLPIINAMIAVAAARNFDVIASNEKRLFGGRGKFDMTELIAGQPRLTERNDGRAAKKSEEMEKFLTRFVMFRALELKSLTDETDFVQRIDDNRAIERLLRIAQMEIENIVGHIESETFQPAVAQTFG